MIKYILKKLLNWLIMIVLATNLTYFLAWAYMKPRTNLELRAEGGKPLKPAEINRLLDRYNLNDQVPIFERWLVWAKGIVLHWDWGQSLDGEAVRHQIAFRVWVSMNLVLLATVLSTIIG
ncbi:MAG: ABC transporter permease, partial [Propionibacteriaceae bacterium]